MRRQPRKPAAVDLYAIGSPNVLKIDILLDKIGPPDAVHPVDAFQASIRSSTAFPWNDSYSAAASSL